MRPLQVEIIRKVIRSNIRRALHPQSVCTSPVNPVNAGVGEHVVVLVGGVNVLVCICIKMFCGAAVVSFSVEIHEVILVKSAVILSGKVNWYLISFEEHLDAPRIYAGCRDACISKIRSVEPVHSVIIDV